MVPLVRAMAGLDAAGLGRYVVVGGVAVAVRLGQAHRATSDVDTVVDESLPPSAVEALLALPGASADPGVANRVYVEGTKIELLGVEPMEPDALEGVPELDALFVASHSWALETAALVTVVAGDDPSVAPTVPVATPAALVAMKLHAIQTRTAAGAPKRAADAWDIYRILVDLDGGGAVRTALATAPGQLRTLVTASAERILDSNAARTRSWLVQGGDDVMASVSAEELRFVAAPLVDALR
jgi:hypothetical protein